MIGRRAPRGDAPIEWFYEYDEGVDPDDPTVRAAALDALRRGPPTMSGRPDSLATPHPPC